MRTWARANWLVAVLSSVIVLLVVYAAWERWQPRSAATTPTPVPGSASSSEASKSVADATTTDVCTKHGTIAWHADNQMNGEVYAESPIGGLQEPCGVVVQTWTDQGGDERFIFYVPPKSVVWISGHRGGTGWYFDPSRGPEADLQKQKAELVQRDGDMKTTVAILPGETFRLVTRIRSATPPATAAPTQTPSSSTEAPAAAPSAPQKPPTTSQVVSGQCNVGGESVGPVIMEGEVNGKATVVKLNAGSKYTLAAGGCFPFPSQSALDARWSDHRSEFLAKYPAGQVLEQ